jgi:hypothetical protein
MEEDTSSSVHSDLLKWARGIYPTEAATRLLLEAFDGRFARRGWPWVARTESGHYYIDATKLSDDEIGMLSGGERRVLAIARSLLGEQTVDLSDAITGLDRLHTDVVIGAIAHATGEHEYRPELSEIAGRDIRSASRSSLRRPNKADQIGMTR